MLYKLFLDESGTPNPLSANDKTFPYFVLSGIIIQDNQSERLKIWADRIRFKYWGDLGIVFHSKEIGRKENSFHILRDINIERNFQHDLFTFLNSNGLKCIIVTIDKRKAQQLQWTLKDIYDNSTDKMIQLFIEFLKNKKASGQVIFESAGTQKDIAFYKNYIHYLANGLPSLGLDHKAMKKILTSISFVSKNNHDIESQIADLLAYPAGYQCLVNEGKKVFNTNSYQEKMCQILQNKLITIGNKKSFIQLP